MMFVPQSPYNPAGTLKAALAYPELSRRITATPMR